MTNENRIFLFKKHSQSYNNTNLSSCRRCEKEFKIGDTIVRSTHKRYHEKCALEINLLVEVISK